MNRNPNFERLPSQNHVLYKKRQTGADVGHHHFELVSIWGQARAGILSFVRLGRTFFIERSSDEILAMTLWS